VRGRKRNTVHTVLNREREKSEKERERERNTVVKEKEREKEMSREASQFNVPNGYSKNIMVCCT
jgi:hypothetical protein